MTKALVVGGTGPTGPHVVGGLLARGFDVTIFHRGIHEPAGLADVEHIHGDPHFRESIYEALSSRRFEVVVAMYGRVKLLAAALTGRCERFLSISGVPVYSGFFPRPGLPRLPIPVTENHPVVRDHGAEDPALRFSRRLAEAEDAVLTNHPGATVLRFPMVYGPNNPRPIEWSVLRRLRDGRPHIVLPDGGFQIHSRCAARNAAAFVLSAVDHPDRARGQTFNCGDPVNWSLREWAEIIVELSGAEIEIVSIPGDVAVEAATTLMPLGNTTAPHCLVSIEKARRLLGYEPAMDPLEAMRETLDWYASDPSFDPAASPAFTDRFDYSTEDQLIAAYRSAAASVTASVRQHPQPPIHSMPHPKAPGAADHRGR